jgi:hypothetical protein
MPEYSSWICLIVLADAGHVADVVARRGRCRSRSSGPPPLPPNMEYAASAARPIQPTGPIAARPAPMPPIKPPPAAAAPGRAEGAGGGHEAIHPRTGGIGEERRSPRCPGTCRPSPKIRCWRGCPGCRGRRRHCRARRPRAVPPPPVIEPITWIRIGRTVIWYSMSTSVDFSVSRSFLKVSLPLSKMLLKTSCAVESISLPAFDLVMSIWARMATCCFCNSRVGSDIGDRLGARVSSVSSRSWLILSISRLVSSSIFS